jgi:GNAT superfamily N-acetyltransferase
MVGHGERFWPAEHDGFVAGDWEGVITYRIDGDRCEVSLIDAISDGAGIGTALLDAVVSVARRAGCADVWLVTTNDNVRARAWYGRRGFRVVAVREGAIDRARAELKPTIPTHNPDTGLPISDEIEMALSLV